MPQFQPGQSGNPNGREKLPEDIKQARKLTRVEFERLANTFLHMTPHQIETRCKQPDCTMIELMIGGIIQKAIKEGDQRRLDFLLDRLIGKVVQPIELPPPPPEPMKNVGLTIDVKKLSLQTLKELADANPEAD